MSELERLRRENRDLREMYRKVCIQVNEYEKYLGIANETISEYQKFLVNHPHMVNWMRDFNAQFQAFKASPYWIEPTPEGIDRKIVVLKRSIRLDKPT